VLLGGPAWVDGVVVTAGALVAVTSGLETGMAPAGWPVGAESCCGGGGGGAVVVVLVGCPSAGAGCGGFGCASGGC
jgi:hypothetical protein